MRSYVADLAGGTVTTTIQIQSAGTIKALTLSVHNAAAGKVEVSTSGSSQIGTAQPTSDVIFRLNNSATAGDVVLNVPCNVPVKAFQSLYVHQTGAGNLGSISFTV